MTFDTPHGRPIDIHAVITRSTAPAAIISSPSVHMRLRAERQPVPPLAEDLAHERHRRAREEAAADGDVVAVASRGRRRRRRLVSFSPADFALASSRRRAATKSYSAGFRRRISQPAW